MDNKKYSKIHGHNYKRLREKNCRTENKWKQNKINGNKLLLISKVSCILSNLWKSMIQLKIHYIFVWVKTKVTLFPHITSIFLAYFASVLCSRDSAVAYDFVLEIARQVSNSTSSSLSMYIYCRFQKANGNFVSKL